LLLLLKIKNMSRKFYNATSQFTAWTKTEDATLKKMVEEGKNSAQIAETMGRTRASIFARKSKLGIKTKMSAARGSKMPYVGFSKTKRNSSTSSIPATSLETLPVSPKKDKTLGDHIDTLISSAKILGLNLKIEISTDDRK